MSCDFSKIRRKGGDHADILSLHAKIALLNSEKEVFQELLSELSSKCENLSNKLNHDRNAYDKILKKYEKRCSKLQKEIEQKDEEISILIKQLNNREDTERNSRDAVKSIPVTGHRESLSNSDTACNEVMKKIDSSPIDALDDDKENKTNHNHLSNGHLKRQMLHNLDSMKSLIKLLSNALPENRQYDQNDKTGGFEISYASYELPSSIVNDSINEWDKESQLSFAHHNDDMTLSHSMRDMARMKPHTDVDMLCGINDEMSLILNHIKDQIKQLNSTVLNDNRQTVDVSSNRQPTHDPLQSLQASFDGIENAVGKATETVDFTTVCDDKSGFKPDCHESIISTQAKTSPAPCMKDPDDMRLFYASGKWSRKGDKINSKRPTEIHLVSAFEKFQGFSPVQVSYKDPVATKGTLRMPECDVIVVEGHIDIDDINRGLKSAMKPNISISTTVDNEYDPDDVYVDWEVVHKDDEDHSRGVTSFDDDDLRVLTIEEARELLLEFRQLLSVKESYIEDLEQSLNHNLDDSDDDIHYSTRYFISPYNDSVNVAFKSVSQSPKNRPYILSSRYGSNLETIVEHHDEKESGRSEEYEQDEIDKIADIVDGVYDDDDDDEVMEAKQSKKMCFGKGKYEQAAVAHHDTSKSFGHFECSDVDNEGYNDHDQSQFSLGLGNVGLVELRTRPRSSLSCVDTSELFPSNDPHQVLNPNLGASAIDMLNEVTFTPKASKSFSFSHLSSSPSEKLSDTSNMSPYSGRKDDIIMRILERKSSMMSVDDQDGIDTEQIDAMMEQIYQEKHQLELHLLELQQQRIEQENDTVSLYSGFSVVNDDHDNDDNGNPTLNMTAIMRHEYDTIKSQSEEIINMNNEISTKNRIIKQLEDDNKRMYDELKQKDNDMLHLNLTHQMNRSGVDHELVERLQDQIFTLQKLVNLKNEESDQLWETIYSQAYDLLRNHSVHNTPHSQMTLKLNFSADNLSESTLTNHSPESHKSSSNLSVKTIIKNLEKEIAIKDQAYKELLVQYETMTTHLETMNTQLQLQRDLIEYRTVQKAITTTVTYADKEIQATEEAIPRPMLTIDTSHGRDSQANLYQRRLHPTSNAKPSHLKLSVDVTPIDPDRQNDGTRTPTSSLYDLKLYTPVSGVHDKLNDITISRLIETTSSASPVSNLKDGDDTFYYSDCGDNDSVVYHSVHSVGPSSHFEYDFTPEADEPEVRPNIITNAVHDELLYDYNTVKDDNRLLEACVYFLRDELHKTRNKLHEVSLLHEEKHELSNNIIPDLTVDPNPIDDNYTSVDSTTISIMTENIPKIPKPHTTHIPMTRQSIASLKHHTLEREHDGGYVNILLHNYRTDSNSSSPLQYSRSTNSSPLISRKNKSNLYSYLKPSVTDKMIQTDQMIDYEKVIETIEHTIEEYNETIKALEEETESLKHDLFTKEKLILTQRQALEESQAKHDNEMKKLQVKYEALISHLDEDKSNKAELCESQAKHVEALLNDASLWEGRYFQCHHALKNMMKELNKYSNPTGVIPRSYSRQYTHTSASLGSDIDTEDGDQRSEPRTGSVSPLSGSSTMDHNHPPTPHSLHTHNDYIEKIKFLEEKIAKLSDDEHRIRQAAHEQITQALTLSNDVRAQSAMKTEQINELQTDLNRKQNQITEQINLILRLKQMVKSLGGDPSSVDPSPKEVKTHAFKF